MQAAECNDKTNSHACALPPDTHTIQRLIKNCCSEYNEIATACGTHEVSEVQKAVEKHRGVLQRDNNYGLVKQVLEAVYSRNIQRLTQTFVTLSLSDIGEQVKLGGADQAKKRVLEMIERNMIVATIDEQMGMVSFDTEPDKTSSQQLLLRLTAQIQVSGATRPAEDEFRWRRIALCDCVVRLTFQLQLKTLRHS